MGLTPRAYVALVVYEASSVEPPQGPPRLAGSPEQFDDCVGSVLTRMARIPVQHQPDGAQLPYATERALELTSYLYASGAEHAQWRHWSAITAFGLALQGQTADAVAYAALAGEWTLIASMRASPPTGRSSMPRQLWPLVTNSSASASTDDDDDLDQAWNELLIATKNGDDARIEAALTAIVEWWWEESDDDWRYFHPYSYPDFDAPICAAAASVRHYGYEPKRLGADVAAYLDAGLALDYPPPLYPSLKPLYTTARGGET